MKNLAAVALINALHDYNSTSRQRREVEAVRKFETGSWILAQEVYSLSVGKP